MVQQRTGDTLRHGVRRESWKAQLLDHPNSGEVAGDKDRGVPDSSLISASLVREDLTEPERRILLGLARRSLRDAAANVGMPEVAATDVPPGLGMSRACFVTLTRNGKLRGCIGRLIPTQPLFEAVIETARNAAVRDPRFPAVQPDEVDEIKIEISVLTEPTPLQFSSPEELLAQLQPPEDGVVLTIAGRTATFLPQVWKQMPDKTQFLDHLAQKAGCEASAWREKEVAVAVYRVEKFGENGPGD